MDRQKISQRGDLMKARTIFIKSLFLILAFMATSAQAENRALMTLLKALQENGTIDIQTYELVKKVAEAESMSEQQVVEEITRKEIEKSAGKVVKAKVEHIQMPKVSSKHKLRIGGRLQVDAAVYDEDVARHNDGTEIRRARLYALGDLGNDWAYMLQYDFTGSGVNGIGEAWLAYKGLDLFDIQVGHFKEPFSNRVSSKHFLFLERGLPDVVFDKGRNLGIGLTRSGKNWSISGGLFGEGPDGASDDNDEGYGASSRVTYAPLFEKTHVWFMGASAAYRSTGSDDLLRLRARPDSHVTNTHLVDTGDFDVDSYNRFNAEMGYVYGPFHLEGEYYYTSLERDNAANPDLDFSGFFVQGGWFLTGESMSFDPVISRFGRLSPNAAVGDGGIGAWQVALRFSSLDLTDEDIFGGEQENFTVGLNWYPTANIRFMANYVNVLDVSGGPHDGDKPEVFQFRSQVEF
jgi:phosphate-selective porin OprO and OprP